MIPEELKKPIDEIKTPSNRILVICLILAIISLSSIITYQNRHNTNITTKDLDDCIKIELEKNEEIRQLNKFIIDKQEEENKRLKKREAAMDSIIMLTKFLSRELKK